MERIMPYLELKNVCISYSGSAVINDISFSLQKGETIGIAGESGCGKSTLAKAVLGILPKNADITGSIKYCGKELIGMPEKEFAKLRGGGISMVFQDPSAALNPVRKIKHQFYDIFGTRRSARKSADEKIIHFLRLVHLQAPETILNRYPAQLSGGMKQRIVIAMAICKAPQLLITDEPTSALDAEIRLQIIEELMSLKKHLGFGMIYISHNLAELSKVADSILVMKNGSLIECQKTAELFANPRQTYTKELIAAAE